MDHDALLPRPGPKRHKAQHDDATPAARLVLGAGTGYQATVFLLACRSGAVDYARYRDLVALALASKWLLRALATQGAFARFPTLARPLLHQVFHHTGLHPRGPACLAAAAREVRPPAGGLRLAPSSRWLLREPYYSYVASARCRAVLLLLWLAAPCQPRGQQSYERQLRRPACNTGYDPRLTRLFSPEAFSDWRARYREAPCYLSLLLDFARACSSCAQLFPRGGKQQPGAPLLCCGQPLGPPGLSVLQIFDVVTLEPLAVVRAGQQRARSRALRPWARGRVEQLTRDCLRRTEAAWGPSHLVYLETGGPESWLYCHWAREILRALPPGLRWEWAQRRLLFSPWLPPVHSLVCTTLGLGPRATIAEAFAALTPEHLRLPACLCLASETLARALSAGSRLRLAEVSDESAFLAALPDPLPREPWLFACRWQGGLYRRDPEGAGFCPVRTEAWPRLLAAAGEVLASVPPGSRRRVVDWGVLSSTLALAFALSVLPAACRLSASREAPDPAWPWEAGCWRSAWSVVQHSLGAGLVADPDEGRRLDVPPPATAPAPHAREAEDQRALGLEVTPYGTASHLRQLEQRAWTTLCGRPLQELLRALGAFLLAPEAESQRWWRALASSPIDQL